MKIFEVFNDICHHEIFGMGYDEAVKMYAPIKIIEAPDYVFEGWGYMNGEFIKPETPSGWLYDDVTGTFYPENETPPSEQISTDKKVERLELENNLLRQQIQSLSNQNDFQEELIVELANIVYA